MMFLWWPSCDFLWMSHVRPLAAAPSTGNRHFWTIFSLKNYLVPQILSDSDDFWICCSQREYKTFLGADFWYSSYFRKYDVITLPGYQKVIEGAIGAQRCNGIICTAHPVTSKAKEKNTFLKKWRRWWRHQLPGFQKVIEGGVGDCWCNGMICRACQVTSKAKEKFSFFFKNGGADDVINFRVFKKS